MSQSIRVRILLDVDGVIVPMSMPGAPRDHWPEDSWVPAGPGGSLGLEYSTAMVDQLRALAELDGVDGSWCTTWGEQAPAVLGPAIGLGQDWPALTPEPQDSHFAEDRWWKAERAREAVATHHAVVWIDDLIDSWRENLTAAGADGSESWPGGQLLTVCPSSERGLEPHHLEQISTFIRSA